MADPVRRGSGGFLAAEGGNISIIAAVSMLMLLAATGVAIDGSRMAIAKYKFQRAADAAALAAGTTYATQEELDALADRFVKQNFAMSGTTIEKVKAVPGVDEVDIEAEMRISLFFMKLFTDEEPLIRVSTNVRRAGGGLMVAMVLDNTGSMWGGLSGTTRIEALRAASLRLTDDIFKDKTEEENLRVAVVPYAAMVNPGDEAEDIVDLSMTSHFRVQDPQGRTGLAANELAVLSYAPGNETQWKGCVYERPGANSLADTPPTSEYWQPLIWPIYNDNQYEVFDSGLDKGKPDPATIDPGGDRNTNAFTGPNVGCPTPVLPLTKFKQPVIDALNAMTAWNRGGTLGDIGMAWGIRALSPGAPFTQSATELDSLNAMPIWDSPRWRRAIVLMTDGDNVVFDAGNHGSQVQDEDEDSDLTAYGRLGDAQFRQTLDTGNRGTAQDLVDDRLAALCASAKAQQMVVYTVVFATSAGNDTKTLFRNCASDPGKYFFAPDPDALDDAFGAIGADLNRLRITR